MKFVLIPPGEFLMGSTPEEIAAALRDIDPNDTLSREWGNSEAPQHKVVLTQPTYLGTNEVTQAEFTRVMGVNPSSFAPTGNDKQHVVGIETGSHPVESVTWYEASEFCAKLSEQETLKPFDFQAGELLQNCTGYRLPSEAEWEFACRAGTTTNYWTGDKDEDLGRAAWFGHRPVIRTHAIGELQANPFGLFDIHGNAWEWVQDRMDKTFYHQFREQPAINPCSPFSEGSECVIRGGNWYYHAAACRSSDRRSFLPTRRDSATGFRVSLAVDAVKAALANPAPKPPMAQSTILEWKGWPADAPAPAIAPFDAAKAREYQKAWAEHLGVPVEYTNSIDMKFVLIPPGEFTMGSTPEDVAAFIKVATDKYWKECMKSEGPQHKVILAQAIYLGIHEVTQAEYEKVVGTNPSCFAPQGLQKNAVAGLDTSSFPVEHISWNDAAEFCAKLSEHEKLKPFYLRSGATVTMLKGSGYRLPTEAEWEFSCRAGTTTKFSMSDNGKDLPEVGWIRTNDTPRTHSVGWLNANAFGLFDMHGNVWEWVQDWWETTYYGQFPEKAAINPSGPSSSGKLRVVRGGSWNDPAFYSRSALRHAFAPTGRGEVFGFRVSLTVDAVKAKVRRD